MRATSDSTGEGAGAFGFEFIAGGKKRRALLPAFESSATARGGCPRSAQNFTPSLTPRTRGRVGTSATMNCAVLVNMLAFTLVRFCAKASTVHGPLPVPIDRS